MANEDGKGHRGGAAGRPRPPIKATVSLRIDLQDGRVGPGKVLLLERIAEQGSIAAAGRALGMSYRRAWELVDELNKCFGSPVVRAQTGGKRGGGTVVTEVGLALVAHYREMESKAVSALEPHLRALARKTRPRR
jgi:molybdate transport system regulatory protein